MKIKILLSLTAVVAALAAGAPAGAQGIDNEVLHRLAYFLTPPIDKQYPVEQAGYMGMDPCYAEDFYCNSGGCGDCTGCCHTMDVWGSVEVLLWWAKGTPLPPLATTALSGTPPGIAGRLDTAGTRILFGDELAGQKIQVGGRVELGMWLDPEHNTSVSGRFFALDGDNTHFAAASTGDPILARPFFNALLNQQDARLIAYPDLLAGSINGKLENQNVLGAEALMQLMMLRDVDRRVDAVIGYQFLRLDDWFQINSSSQVIEAGSPFLGVTTDQTDRFSAQNQFHGGVIGLKAKLARGCWAWDVLGKVGIGNLHESVSIFGQTTITPPVGGAIVTPGGLLAQPSNIGTYSRDKFIFVPELTINLKYYVNRCVSFHVGYNILWLSDLALSGQQIDFVVNPAQVPGPVAGPARPAFVFRDDDYWLQGINFGMNWDF